MYGRLNIKKICKNYYFKYWILLYAILRLVFLHSIENVSKFIIWSSDHMNLVNDNAIELNFDDFLLEILHLFFVREFNFININSVDFRTYSLCIKLINTYDSNKETCFHKYLNLRCVFNWCSFVWLIHKSNHVRRIIKIRNIIRINISLVKYSWNISDVFNCLFKLSRNSVLFDRCKL